MNQTKQRHSRWGRPRPVHWEDELPEGARVLSINEVLMMPNGMAVDVYGFSAKHELRRHRGHVVQYGMSKVFRWWDEGAGKFRTEPIREYSARAWVWPEEAVSS